MPRRLPEPSVDSFDLTTILSALADPTRRAVMVELSRQVEPVNCAGLAVSTEHDLSKPTMSHHFRILREAGLTRTVADGRHRIIEIRRADMESRFPGLLEAVLTAT